MGYAKRLQKFDAMLIFQERDKRRWLLGDVAERIGVAKSSLSTYLRQGEGPIPVVHALAGVFGLPMDEVTAQHTELDRKYVARHTRALKNGSDAEIGSFSQMPIDDERSKKMIFAHASGQYAPGAHVRATSQEFFVEKAFEIAAENDQVTLQAFINAFSNLYPTNYAELLRDAP